MIMCFLQEQLCWLVVAPEQLWWLVVAPEQWGSRCTGSASSFGKSTRGPTLEVLQCYSILYFSVSVLQYSSEQLGGRVR